MADNHFTTFINENMNSINTIVPIFPTAMENLGGNPYNNIDITDNDIFLSHITHL